MKSKFGLRILVDSRVIETAKTTFTRVWWQVQVGVLSIKWKRVVVII